MGSDYARLKNMAGKYTRFLGKVNKHQLRKLYQEARALLQPGVEDFGMAAAEALACGTPVIACGQGGVKEMVVSGEHGWLYDGERAESLAEGLRQFMLIENTFRPEVLQRQAQKFSKRIFEEKMKAQVQKALLGARKNG